MLEWLFGGGRLQKVEYVPLKCAGRVNEGETVTEAIERLLREGQAALVAELRGKLADRDLEVLRLLQENERLRQRTSQNLTASQIVAEAQPTRMGALEAEVRRLAVEIEALKQQQGAHFACKA